MLFNIKHTNPLIINFLKKNPSEKQDLFEINFQQAN